MELEWLGPYQLVRKLGRGGMGVVYEGVDVETGQRAALKVLSAALSEDEDFRSRFETEIETLRRLKHPNIVRLFGFGQQEGLLFYAMELVDGPSLEGELRRGRRFSWQETAQMGLQICRGLRHAHDRGVIHRDLKPGNLLLAADGTVKLADFGIAQLFGRSRLTAVGTVVGTLDYMAPEQAEGGVVDARADLYSLGAVLYCLLSGRPPLRAKTLAEMLEKLHHNRPEPIRQLVPDVPEPLEQLLEQLLEKDPQRRMATAQMAARRLEALLQEAQSLPDAPTEFPPAGIEAVSGPAEAGRKLLIPSAKPSPDALPEEVLGREEPNVLEAAAGAGAGSPELPETKPMTWPPGLAPQAFASQEGSADALGSEPVPKGPDNPSMQMDLEGAAAVPSPANQASYQPPPTQDATPAQLRPVGSSFPERESVPPERKTSDHAASVPLPAPESTKPSHFIPVSEEQLDQLPPEEPVRPWISWQTWVLAGALLAVGGAVWYLLQPPSPDALYNRVVHAAQEGSIEALRAVEPAIQEFLARYPSDPRAEQIRQYERELDLDRLERRFELHASGRLRRQGALSPCERAYAEAVAIARTNPDLGIVKLQALLDLYEHRSERSGPLGACLELARRRLQRLQQELKEQLAGAEQLLEERLRRAEQLEPSSPDTARAIRQAIVELYADKPWAASVVAQAKAALARSPAKPNPDQPRKPSSP